MKLYFTSYTLIPNSTHYFGSGSQETITENIIIKEVYILPSPFFSKINYWFYRQVELSDIFDD